MQKSWDNFMNLGLELLMESPLARVVVKYNQKKEIGILKVTDDRKWVLFKAKSIDQVEQFVKLTSKLMLKVDPTEEQVQMQEEDTKLNKKQQKKKGKGKK